MYPTTFKKYSALNRFVLIGFTLYMLNAFTLVNLFLHFTSVHLGCGNAVTQQTSSHFKAPKSAGSPALYLFLSHRKLFKANTFNQALPQCKVISKNYKVAVVTPAITYVSSPYKLQLSDDAYKRYRNLNVFLI